MQEAEEECDRLRAELKELLEAAGVMSTKDDRIAIVSLEPDVSVCVNIIGSVGFIIDYNNSMDITSEG